jgi:hypothetical protein
MTVEGALGMTGKDSFVPLGASWQGACGHYTGGSRPGSLRGICNALTRDPWEGVWQESAIGNCGIIYAIHAGIASGALDGS